MYINFSVITEYSQSFAVLKVRLINRLMQHLFSSLMEVGLN
jgi:hypothetical protein